MQSTTTSGVWTLISMPDGTDLMREESSLKPVQNTGRFRNGKWQWVITHGAHFDVDCRFHTHKALSLRSDTVLT